MLSKGGKPVELMIGRTKIGNCAQVRVNIGPVDARGKELIAHELTHLVQQRAGQKVKLTLSGLSLEKPTALKGQVVQIAMRDATGRQFAVEGRVVEAGGNDVLQQEWSLTYESIQRVL